ncbi:putative pectinesterase [Arabidopsis thaliana]|uniref:Pectinesterase inhibitor domain-containing protein n=2 Tax=Arabidopsis TaxID=3701 RepID=A0A178VJH5_ARATH|nr:Invertase/pectin methylesterase inhibitor domain superfamily [Arabidopsis thaliana x Arabidopsis arenosa]OAP05904.1 hypothetical protein AXX17_AT3G06530 [Arabidopsis thaliana]
MEFNKTNRIIVIFTVSILVTISTHVESRSDSPFSAPAPAPEVMKPIASPANSPAEIYTDSPAASLEAPADSFSPTNPPSEIDIYSPATSPEALVASPEALAESSSAAPSGIKVSSSPRSLLNPPLLSPEIKTICGKTDNPPLCESSVSPLLTPQLKPDTSSVLILAIQASITATKAAMATVEKVDASDCQELYDDAVVNLEEAVNAVKSSDIATVNTNLSAAMTDYSTCNDGFEESGEPNPLADVADKLTKMVSNCLAISTLIK